MIQQLNKEAKFNELKKNIKFLVIDFGENNGEIFSWANYVCWNDLRKVWYENSGINLYEYESENKTDAELHTEMLVIVG